VKQSTCSIVLAPLEQVKKKRPFSVKSGNLIVSFRIAAKKQNSRNLSYFKSFCFTS
jgi:hypothetical protein